MADQADQTHEPFSVILEQEHHDIDAGLAAFQAKLTADEVDAALLTTTLEALRRHIYLEEVLLFPPLRVGGLMMPIMVMIREHGDMWRLMEDLTAEATGGGDVAKLTATLTELTELLERHNSKEEPVIYPHADNDMPPQAATKLMRFIESGSTPDGWVCQQAAS